MTRDEIDKLPVHRYPLRHVGSYVTDGAWMVLGTHPHARPAGEESEAIVASWVPQRPVSIVLDTATPPWVECPVCGGSGRRTCPTCQSDYVCTMCDGCGGAGTRLVEATVVDGDRRLTVNHALVPVLDGLDLYVCGSIRDSPDSPVIGGYRDGKLVAAVAPLRPECGHD